MFRRSKEQLLDNLESLLVSAAKGFVGIRK